MFRPNPLSLAVSLALLGSVNAHAAETAPADDTVQITGIRASLQKSIEAKRNAGTNVEVVTAEDVGKMPDKNIADALSRVAGVNVQYGGALAMDEAERVAIRGTSPNLNLVTINSHALSSGDWHVGDQGSSGRSVGFGLMPSQLIGRSIVYKNQRADITEGGIAGTVDIELRKPLDFRQNLTTEASIGVVHADLPGKTDPQLSGLVSWKNDSKTLGVLVQAFMENRHLRRDGQETFSFGVITPAQAAASGNPALANKRMPGSLNSALFEGKRERKGAYVGLQFKPSEAVDINLSAFRAELKADNYNSSGFALPTGLISQGWLIRDAVIDGNVITSARLVAPTKPVHASGQAVGFQFDHNVREGAKSLSSFYDADVKFRVTDKLTLRGRVGYTEGCGDTQSQPSLFFGIVNPNMSYAINGSRPTDYALSTPLTGAPIDLGKVSSYVQMGNPPAAVFSKDEESYFHLDGSYSTDWPWLTALKFGARGAEHERDLKQVSWRWNAQDKGGAIVSPSPIVSIGNGTLVSGFVNPADVPAPATRYPGDWGSGLDANFPRDLFRFDPAQVQAFAAKYANFDSVGNLNLTSAYTVKEKNLAAYLMGEFDLDKLSGNYGVRWVRTDVDSRSYQSLGATCAALQPCAVPGAIVGSRLGTWRPQDVSTSHDAILPSLNLRYALSKDLIFRAATSRSLGRPNYNELAGAVTLNNTLLTGSSGNPNLKPITSTNLDASLAWYFAPRAYVSGSVFRQGINDYVKTGLSKVTFFNTLTQQDAVYDVTSRVGVGAKLQGAELAGELPIGSGFGVGANMTYVDAKDNDGVALLGTSKTTWNLVGFYENNSFSARIAWNQRSDYAIGFVGNGKDMVTYDAAGIATYNGLHKYKGSGTLSASINYKLNDNMSVSLDGNNLNNPVRHTYFMSENAPGYWHESGRQYFLNLRMKY